MLYLIEIDGRAGAQSEAKGIAALRGKYAVLAHVSGLDVEGDKVAVHWIEELTICPAQAFEITECAVGVG